MESGANTVVSAVTTGLTTMGNDLSSVIAAVIPIALGIVGAVTVAYFGVKVFKKLIG